MIPGDRGGVGTIKHLQQRSHIVNAQADATELRRWLVEQTGMVPRQRLLVELLRQVDRQQRAAVSHGRWRIVIDPSFLRLEEAVARS